MLFSLIPFFFRLNSFRYNFRGFVASLKFCLFLLSYCLFVEIHFNYSTILCLLAEIVLKQFFEWNLLEFLLLAFCMLCLAAGICLFNFL